MPRLTLRTLLAYIDDTLEPNEARSLGKKVAASDEAKQLVERIKKVTRRRGLATPVATDTNDDTADPNTVAAYLDNSLDSDTVKQLEETCLESDVHLAEVAACHQILTLLLTEPVRVPPRAHKRMYQLVKRPASAPNRRPNKKLPVSGLPPAPDQGDADEADAALLLGMKRYSATTTWAARLALIGVAAVLLLLLSAAVLVSLPHPAPKPPEVSPGHSYVLLQPPIVELPAPPAPKPVEKPPAPKPDDNEVAALPVAPAPHPVGDLDPAGPGLGDPPAPPNNDRREIAQVKTNRVLVVARVPKTDNWVRLKVKPDDAGAVMASDTVMALPGYKAELSADKKVLLTLWGNVPEQLPYRVLESRVKLHVPPAGFDADITLLSGRVYLRSERDAGAKVRLRLADEVWDVTLPDAKSSVLAELVSWYEPGTVYNRKGGAPPRREGRLAVVTGAATFETRGDRFKKFEKIPQGSQVTWDSATNVLNDPARVPPELQDVLLNPAPADAQKGKLTEVLARILTQTADRVTSAEAVSPVIKNLVGPDLPPEVADRDRDLVARLAIYSYAALADSNEAGASTLASLVDVLRSQLPWLARQAVVTALVNWVARDVGNTALLHTVLVEKGLSDADADRLLTLLRAYVSPTNPDGSRLDNLVAAGPNGEPPLLGDPELALREAALWNVMVARLGSWVPLPLNVNVGATGAKAESEDYKRFLADSKKWIDEVKKRPKK